MKVKQELFGFDEQKRLRHPVLCGVDEAGRGPLCGPVCVAAVVLRPGDEIEGVNDSKKISEKNRELLYDVICSRALAYNVVFVGPEEIDSLNILHATLAGMRRCVQGLALRPDHVLIDGNRCPEMPFSCEAVVKGDGVSASIAAASVLAKVSRDRFMLELDRQYPEYCLAQHKGYPTRLHYEMLDRYGVKDFYRKSFLVKRGYVDAV